MPSILQKLIHYHSNDVIMGAITSQIPSLTIVCSAVYSGADQRKHQRSASLAFVRGIHRGRPVNSPHKGPVTRKTCPFDDAIMMAYVDVLTLALKVVSCNGAKAKKPELVSCLLLGVSSVCARPITEQVTSETWLVIG